MRKALLILGALLLMAGSTFSTSAQQEKQPAPDNTKINQGDANKKATTADQQKMNEADRQTTKQIRAALTADKSLSTYAHNIKIVTQDGKVTLKGPVRSEEEKSAIEAKAKQVAGESNVTNNLTIAPATSAKQY